MSKAEHLPTDQFLQKLKELLNSANETQVVVRVKMTRLLVRDPVALNEEFNAEDFPFADVPSTSNIRSSNNKEYPILIRVSHRRHEDKKKLKYACVVKADGLDKFWQNYVSVLKSGTSRLAKTKKKKAKTKAKPKAKAKNVSAVDARASSPKKSKHIPGTLSKNEG